MTAPSCQLGRFRKGQHAASNAAPRHRYACVASSRMAGKWSATTKATRSGCVFLEEATDAAQL
jgi:hypothetical protein